MLPTDKPRANNFFFAQYSGRIFAVAFRKKGSVYWNYQNKDSTRSRCEPRGWQANMNRTLKKRQAYHCLCTKLSTKQVGAKGLAPLILNFATTRRRADGFIPSRRLHCGEKPPPSHNRNLDGNWKGPTADMNIVEKMTGGCAWKTGNCVTLRNTRIGNSCSTVVKVLCQKSEGRWFRSQLVSVDFSLI